MDGKNSVPPRAFSHTVSPGGSKGKQKMPAIWHIGDTAGAFYSCVNVNIG